MGDRGSGRKRTDGVCNIVLVKHHFGSKRFVDPEQEAHSRPKLVTDRLGHVALIVKNGERFLIDSS
jgi:hypothetical protein